jgi:hypothetical protein
MYASMKCGERCAIFLIDFSGTASRAGRVFFLADPREMMVVSPLGTAVQDSEIVETCSVIPQRLKHP